MTEISTECSKCGGGTNSQKGPCNCAIEDRKTRELLEMAAKAAGIDINAWIECGTYGAETRSWNPLEYDGDCASMEGANHISITWDYPNRCVRVRAKRWMDSFEHSEPYGDDWQAARRLASTTLMAKIGRKTA